MDSSDHNSTTAKDSVGKKSSKWIQVTLASLALVLLVTVMGIFVLHIVRHTPQERLAIRHVRQQGQNAFPLRAIVILPLDMKDCLAAQANTHAPLEFANQKNSAPWCVAVNWTAETTLECTNQTSDCGKQITLCNTISTDAPIYVLLLHGIKCSGEVWLAVVRHWMSKTAKKIVFICPDLLGHGKSSWPKDSKYTVELHIEALERLLASLMRLQKQNRIASIHIVGHSLGAMLALELTAKLLRSDWLHVSSLTLMATPYFESREQATESANAHSFWFRNQWLATTCCGYLVCRQNWLWKKTLGRKFAKEFPQLPHSALEGGLQHNHHGIKSTIESVVLDHRARPALEAVCRARVPTLLIDSDADRLCTVSQKRLRKEFEELAPRHFYSVTLNGAKHGFIVHNYIETTMHLQPFIETVSQSETRLSIYSQVSQKSHS